MRETKKIEGCCSMESEATGFGENGKRKKVGEKGEILKETHL